MGTGCKGGSDPAADAGPTVSASSGASSSATNTAATDTAGSTSNTGAPPSATPSLDPMPSASDTAAETGGAPSLDDAMEAGDDTSTSGLPDAGGSAIPDAENTADESAGDEGSDDGTDAPVASQPSPSGPDAAAGTPPQLTSEFLAQHFVAYWDFEQVEGTRVIDVVSKQHALELTGEAPAEGGLAGKALPLDGMASASSEAALLDTTGSFSVAAWVRLDELHAFDTFVSQSGASVSAFYLQKRDDDRYAFATFSNDDTSQAACVTSAAIAPRPGEWVHLVATRDAESGQQRLYVDGALSGKSQCQASLFAAQGPLAVGRGTWDGADADQMNGAVDELGIAGKVLDAETVLALYRAGRSNAAYYLFAYFVEVSQGRGDGLRLAYSHDGLYWGAIGAGKVFMPPSVGGGSFRDPHLMRGPSGEYHLVFTTSCVPWAESNCVQDRGFGHAVSQDLVNWEAATYVTIDLDVEHVWAPETYYDAESEQFMVFWSSPPDTSSGSDPHQIYYLLTKDFASFSEPQVLYSQPGRNFIDATIRREANDYLMVLKDEADGQKNLRALRSPALFGATAWQSAPSSPITGNYGAEGPSFLEREGDLFVYFDKYGEGAYGALRATAGTELDSPSAWQDISNSIFFPGVRHGTPLEVPEDVFEQVALAAAQ